MSLALSSPELSGSLKLVGLDVTILDPDLDEDGADSGPRRYPRTRTRAMS